MNNPCIGHGLFIQFLRAHKEGIKYVFNRK